MSDANYPVTNKGHAKKDGGYESDTRTRKAVDSQKFQRLADDCMNAVNFKELENFAKERGVSAKSLRMLGIGRDGDAWTFPERDAAGQVVGISRRTDRGRKLMVTGSKRGLTMPWPMHADESKYILVVEGASDAAAGFDLGFLTIGRPSATDGLKFLIQLLPDRDVVIVGENDDGAGREGAEKIAQGLSGVAKSVRILYPPEGVKDLRGWVTSGCDHQTLDSAIKATEPFTPAPAEPSPASKPTSGGAKTISREPVMVCMADVVPVPVQWLWPGRIPLGKVSLIAGDPGLGKSLLTIDVAARGLDVKDISHVICYGFPKPKGSGGIEDFEHRIGRTARVGRQGVAWSFVTPDQGQLLTEIEKLTGVLIEQLDYPDFNPGPLPQGVREQRERDGKREEPPAGDGGAEKDDQSGEEYRGDEKLRADAIIEQRFKIVQPSSPCDIPQGRTSRKAVLFNLCVRCRADRGKDL